MPMPQHLTRPSHPRLRRSHRSKAVPALSPHEPPVAPRSPPAPSQPARARHPTLVSALAHPHQIPNPNGIASPTVGLHKRPTLGGVPPVTRMPMPSPLPIPTGLRPPAQGWTAASRPTLGPPQNKSTTLSGLRPRRHYPRMPISHRPPYPLAPHQPSLASRTSPSPYKQPKALDCCQNYSSPCARSAPASPTEQASPHQPFAPFA